MPVAAASASIARHTHWRLDELVLARVSTSQTAPDLVDRLCWVGIVRDAGYEVPRRLPVPPGSPPRTEAPVPRFVEHFGVFLIDARTGKGLWAANM